jgi:hypothetical protein
MSWILSLGYAKFSISASMALEHSTPFLNPILGFDGNHTHP